MPRSAWIFPAFAVILFVVATALGLTFTPSAGGLLFAAVLLAILFGTVFAAVHHSEVIAERIREAVMAEVFQTELGPLKVTLSIGVSTFPDSSTDKHQLIELADGCLYHAKRHGRNQVVTVRAMQAGVKRPRAAG